MTTTHTTCRRRGLPRLLAAALPLAMLAGLLGTAGPATAEPQAPPMTVTVSDVVTPVYGDNLTFRVKATGIDNVLDVYHGSELIAGGIYLGSSVKQVSIPTLGRFRAGVQYKLRLDVWNEVSSGTGTVTFTPRHIPSHTTLASTTVPYGSPFYGRIDATVPTTIKPGGGTMAMQRGSGVTARYDLRTDGTFALNDTAMTPGSYPRVAFFYEGDENYAAHQSGAGTVVAEVTVTKAPTTTTSALTNAKVTQGQPVEVLASTVPSLSDSVADVRGIIEVHAAPAGATEFTKIAEVANPGGGAQVRVPITDWAATHPGFWTIRTVNHGTELAAGSASDAALQVVEPGTSVQDTATALELSAGSATVQGAPVAATAQVTSGGGAVGDGSVTFTVAGQVVATVPVGPDGRAAASVVAPATGEHPVTATYLGTTTYAASVSPARTLSALKAATTTTAVASSAPGGLLSVQVRATGSTVVPTGSVVVSEGGTVLGSVALSGGRADLRLPVLSAGSHVLSVAYAGDRDSEASGATVTTVVPSATNAPSTTKLSLKKRMGHKAKVIVKVSSGATIGGTVQVLRGSKVVATGRLVESGSAIKGKLVLVVKRLKPGINRLTARYLGSATVAASTSKVLKIRIS